MLNMPGISRPTIALLCATNVLSLSLSGALVVDNIKLKKRETDFWNICSRADLISLLEKYHTPNKINTGGKIIMFKKIKTFGLFPCFSTRTKILMASTVAMVAATALSYSNDQKNLVDAISDGCDSVVETIEAAAEDASLEVTKS